MRHVCRLAEWRSVHRLAMRRPSFRGRKNVIIWIKKKNEYYREKISIQRDTYYNVARQAISVLIMISHRNDIIYFTVVRCVRYWRMAARLDYEKCATAPAPPVQRNINFNIRNNISNVFDFSQSCLLPAWRPSRPNTAAVPASYPAAYPAPVYAGKGLR